MELNGRRIHELSFQEFMPVSLFGSVMGLSGLCFAWRLAAQALHASRLIAEIIGWTAILTFIALTITYIAKWIRYPATVEGEFKNSVSVGFFATVTISLLLLPGILLPYAPMIAYMIWLLGVTITLLFAWFVLRKWIDAQQAPESAMPVWVLPVTGTLNVPIAGNSLKFAGAHEICLMFFGIGIIFIIIMMTIIISRLFFQAPLAINVQPSLLILVAPFALAFNGYEGLSGVQDIAASAFFYFCLFLLLIFGSKIALLPKCCPFQVSWWSVSFPLATVSAACLRYAQNRPGNIHWILAAVLLFVATLVILYLLAQTIYQIWSGRFAQPVNTTAIHPRTNQPL
ncbi:MAG: SLAC1 anion channel family protein [Bacteroidota bacterium]|nr:SLAC1 anion channel family protein [Bacteroidota bacterium]